ncbi:serine/threonine-protein kinase HAL4/sat4 [Podochytrium sp. JEL0797]|nr:serine/threonine-protein kinase HAL4/sat4 [Podochytrium sp. JEL0797]
MSTFQSDIWCTGLETKTNTVVPDLPAPTSTSQATPDTTTLPRRVTDRKKSIVGSLASLGRLRSIRNTAKRDEQESIVYRLFHHVPIHSHLPPHPNHPAQAHPDKEHSFAHSRRYNSDSDFDSDALDDSDASSLHSSHSPTLHDRGDSGASPPRPLTKNQRSHSKDLGSLLLFRKSGSKAVADSESESDAESDRGGPRRSSRIQSIKRFLSKKKPSGTTAAAETASPASPTLTASTIPDLRPAVTADSVSAVNDNSESSDTELPPQQVSSSHGNLFKNLLMQGKRRATVLGVVSNSSSASSLNGSSEMLGNSLGGGIQVAGESMPLRNRSPSEASLSEKYGLASKKELGRGVSAVVRLCSPVNSEKKYAVKEFLPKRKGEQRREYVKKLMSEFCISSSLDHENVIKTVDLIQDEQKKWCVVMEFAEGGSLYSKINSGCLETETIYCFYKQLLNGIAYLHSVGVAHRGELFSIPKFDKVRQ